MDKPLTVWYCDVCGERIDNINEGYVIWQSLHGMKAKNFTIIHQSKCDRQDFTSSAALETFVGLNGVTYLLSFLSIGPINELLGQGPKCKISDFDEFVDFFRRVQTPYYEEARRLFGNERLLDWLGDSNEVSPYIPDNLEVIIKEYGTNK
jgi:hypothetical protein